MTFIYDKVVFIWVSGWGKEAGTKNARPLHGGLYGRKDADGIARPRPLTRAYVGTDRHQARSLI